MLLPLLTLVLAHLRSSLNLTSDVLLFLLAIVAVALVGGVWPAVAAAVAGSLLLNYFFVPPLHEFTIAERNNAFAIAAFVAVALMVSAVVDLAARRTSQAARATAQAEVLSTAAGDVLRGERALPALLDRVRETFGMTSVTLLERDTVQAPAPVGRAGGPLGRVSTAPARTAMAGRSGWRVVATSGTQPCARPEEGDTEVPIDDLALVLRGRVRCPPRTAGCWPRSPPRPWSRCGSAGWPTLPPRPGRSPRPTAPARRCSRRSATTCVPRWRRRRPPSRRCAAGSCSGRTPSAPSCWPLPTSRSTG